MTTDAEGLVSTEALLNWSGYSQVAALEKFLRREGIPYRQGKIGPITTRDAITAKLIDRDSREKVEF